MKLQIDNPNLTLNEIILFNLLINSYKMGSIQVYFWRVMSWPNRNYFRNLKFRQIKDQFNNLWKSISRNNKAFSIIKNLIFVFLQGENE